jgi:hypothetical protein
MILSLAEHTLKCLKVEYIGRIKYDFQKSRVPGSWDHKDSVSAKKSKKKIHVWIPLKCTCQAAPSNLYNAKYAKDKF